MISTFCDLGVQALILDLVSLLSCRLFLAECSGFAFGLLVGLRNLFAFSFLSRRIINLGPVMLISEEQPAQPALPIQPEGTRVVCGHCGNTFLVSSCMLVIGR
jgi:hypothetical protein